MDKHFDIAGLLSFAKYSFVQSKVSWIDACLDFLHYEYFCFYVVVID